MLSTPLFPVLRYEMYCCMLAVGYFGQEAERCQQEVTVLNRTVYWITLRLLDVDMPGETEVKRLLWLRTKAAMVLD
jgi:hypothetical protein